jgi:very-short-patch-repair endonuclease
MFRQTLVSRAREMRKEMPLAEVLLWNRLRGDQLGVRFRRQHRVGSYIADLFAHAAKLVVEADGDSHAEREEYDEKRTYWMNQKGLRVMRFTNDDVITNLDSVVQSIADCCSSAARPSPLPSPRSTGEREIGAR